VESIRAFEANDIPQVASLHQRAFGIASSPDLRDRYNRYLTEKFLQPVRAGALPSLVFESDGEVSGFIAVGTRPFVAAGKPIRAALSSQFVVDPNARSKLVAVSLLRAFLAGPQDLSFTDEANETSRRLWERLGGSTACLYSTHWVAPLRPTNLLVSKICFRHPYFASAVTPAVALLDRLAWWISGQLNLAAGTDLDLDELDAASLARALSHDLTDEVRLRPVYDSDSLNKQLADANDPAAGGSLQRALLRSKDERVAGWFVYYVNQKGFAEVLQVGYRHSYQAEVVRHLFVHARRRGAVALSGRLEPHLAKALAGRQCFLFRREHAMLVHSRNPHIANTIHLGHAFISRLEGEWCLRFH
jgi:hypothetical protein